MPFTFDAIFVGVWKCTSITNFIILGLRIGNRVKVSIRVKVTVSIRVRVSFRVGIRLIRYSARHLAIDTIGICAYRIPVGYSRRCF